MCYGKQEGKRMMLPVSLRRTHLRPQVNAFEVGGCGANARALYDTAYLLAHACTPSTTHTDAARARGRPLAVRAAEPHAAGDLLSLCYAYTLQVRCHRVQLQLRAVNVDPSRLTLFTRTVLDSVLPGYEHTLT